LVCKSILGGGLDMKVDLHTMLPAGEWANLQILNQPPGMMAERDWALFAKAKRIRDGGKAAFIKFIVSASPQAGDTTLLVTSGDRLKDVFERLKHFQQMGDTVPIVPLLEIQHTQSGLLIAMEEVTPLRELIDRGEAYHLSAKVLRDLDPDAGGSGWHHFDVCPNNIGVLRSERCVLIDVESFYLEVEGKYRVSVPAWKPFRAPRELEVDVQLQLEAGGIDKSVAARKLRFEIALAAAECVLGQIPSIGNNLDLRTVEAWVAGADAADPAVVFWKRELLAAVDAASFPALQELRVKLESAIKSETEPSGAPLMQVPSVSAEPVQAAGAAISAIPAPPAGSGWLEEWALVQPMVHALRAGRLGGKQIIEYRQILQQLAARYPTQADVWNELLLVVISFEKNPILALSLVTEALQHIPDSEDLSRMRNIVKMWAKERRHGS
jgi:hypothetical protein